MALISSRKKKTWREKLDRTRGLPKVATIGPKLAKRWGEGTMVVASPREVEAIMKAVPCGRLITIQEIRSILASRHRATICCPLTTGIFTWIAAHAAEEAAAKSGDFSETTPYWRTLKAGGFLNEKYPGGIEAQRAKLETEGHAVIARGKRWAASNYEQSLLTEDLRKRLSRDG